MLKEASANAQGGIGNRSRRNPHLVKEGADNVHGGDGNRTRSQMAVVKKPCASDLEEDSLIAKREYKET